MRVHICRAAAAAALLAMVTGMGCRSTAPHGAAGASEPVGRSASGARVVTPVNQVLSPAGRLLELPGLRPQVLALSPDGRLLVTAGKTHELIVVDPLAGTVLQRVPLPSEKAADPAADAVSARLLDPDKEGQASYTGLVFSADGSRLYLSNVNGSVKVFAVDGQGTLSGLRTLPLAAANAPRRQAEIPAGLALSADGARLYVVGNLSNRLLELDAATGQQLRAWDVGVAPYAVVLGGTKAYVSNWGGRQPAPDSLSGPAGRGTLVRVDPVRHIASEGSVSVIDLQAAAPVQDVLTGLHASGMSLSPDGRHLVVANAGSDHLSVIDTRTDQVVETIWAKRNAADLFGASPNAVVFDPAGRRLYVCNGTQNAVAVIEFRPGRSELLGLIPVGWFPGAIAYDARRASLYVANIKGIGPGKTDTATGKVSSNTHQYHGSLSLLPVPSRRQLARHTATVLAGYREPMVRAALLPPRPGQPPRPVPERVGEPSVFRHVVYVIKENRTYDQVLGDLPQGNGDPGLCVFGERITPNLHKLVREFVLLDNTYCAGILSADGHQWSATAFATDYMEKSFAGFPRSYPDGMGEDAVDALAYAPSGFIWDNALAHGLSLRDYGEFAITDKGWADPAKKGRISFRDHYQDYVAGSALIRVASRPAIASLGPYLNPRTVGWDMDIPDQFRAAEFIRELREFEQTGKFPSLVIICLPNDHTSGTREGSPTPAAQVADNDLAFGRIVEAISQGPFWKETCIFGIEDDPQSGWDHVSGYRTTAYVVSPYTRRGAVVSTQYNTTSLLRTIELMLGLPPMNQMDASATPMTDCFTATPDFTAFTAVPNNIPLDQMNPSPKKVGDALLRRQAIASARLPLAEIDKCPEDLLNRILWHAMKGSAAPYPEWAVTVSGAADDDD